MIYAIIIASIVVLLSCLFLYRRNKRRVSKSTARCGTYLLGDQIVGKDDEPFCDPTDRIEFFRRDPN